MMNQSLETGASSTMNATQQEMMFFQDSLKKKVLTACNIQSASTFSFACAVLLLIH